MSRRCVAWIRVGQHIPALETLGTQTLFLLRICRPEITAAILRGRVVQGNLLEQIPKLSVDAKMLARRPMWLAEDPHDQWFRKVIHVLHQWP